MFFLKIPELEHHPKVMWLFEAFALGDYAIYFFFVLSGFLITHLLSVEKSSTGNINVLHFYLRRILRIWPLYYFLLFVGFVFVPMLMKSIGATMEQCSNLLLQLFFLGNFDLLPQAYDNFKCHNPILFITWSVSIEEQFYLVWPLILFGFRIRYWKYLIGMVLAIALVFRVIHHDDWNLIYFHSLSAIGDIALGGLLAIFFTSKLLQPLKSMNDRSRILAYSLGFMVLLARHSIFTFPYGIVVERFIITVFFAFILLDQCGSSSALLKLSRFNFITKWGKYTYGLYLLHPIATFFLLKISAKLPLISGNPILRIVFIFIVGFPLSLFIAYAAYHIFEKRFLNIKKRFTVVRSGSGA